MKIDFEKIENLKKELDKYRPFNEDLAKMLREDLKVRFTYNSNAIEGNTLTIYENKSNIGRWHNSGWEKFTRTLRGY